MKFWPLLILAALPISRCAYASPPPIYPGEAGSESSYPIVRFTDTGCLVAWFYDAGHVWKKAGFYGAGEDCVKARSQVIDAVMLDPNYLPNWSLGYLLGLKLNGLTHAQKDALWNAVFNIQPTDPTYAENKAANDIADAAIHLEFLAIPYPTIAPPSGLVTQDTKVYAVSASTDFNVLSPVGTIPLGVHCDETQSVSNSTGTYYVVPIKSVTWTGTKRLRVYAACNPKIP